MVSLLVQMFLYCCSTHSVNVAKNGRFFIKAFQPLDTKMWEPGTSHKTLDVSEVSL